MLKLALRNLAVRKARTALSLGGLTVAIAGIIALISVSRGIQALVQETVSAVPGLTVLKSDVTSPAFSSLPASLGPEIERIEGVHIVVGQVWFPAFDLEGENPFLKGDVFGMHVVLGLDMQAAGRIRDGGPIGRGMTEGRPLAGENAAEAVIPRSAAERFKKRVGDKIRVVGRELTVAGIFHAGSLLFDRCIVVPLPIARAVAGKDESLVSTFYVELEPGASATAVARRIEERFPTAKAWTTEDVSRETATLWQEVDYFLLAIASIAVVVGAIGIVNTMLMSVMERTGELGVLRATGWTRRDVMRLIVVESAALGLGGGLLGCALGTAIVATAGAMLPLKPVVTSTVLAMCFGLAIGLGTLGGLYPAWRAAKLNPIEAIRT